MKHTRPLLFVSLLAVLAPLAAAAPQETPAELAQERRAEILDTAERYARLEWQGSEKNVLHGEDADGIRVDTADDSIDSTGWHPDGRKSVGMPYSWGGFTSIEEFERGLEAGLYAGLVPKSERAMPSRQAMGLDCSGFVSRCWNLPQKQSTRSLGSLSFELASYDELLPGDILNKFDSHVVLFAGFADEERTRARVIEAARIKVAEAEYDVAVLQANGFVPMRYKPLDARWVPMDRLEAEFEVASTGGEFLPDGTHADLALLRNPLRDARAGEWARYAKTEDRYEGVELFTTRMVARVVEGSVDVQAVHLQQGMSLMRGATRDASAPFTTALVDFAGFVEPIQDLEVVVGQVDNGEYTIGERSFPARRIHAVLEGKLLARHKLFPIGIEVECIQSDEVSLQGVLEAEYRTEVTWSTDENGDRTISQETKTFGLLGFGGVSVD